MKIAIVFPTYWHSQDPSKSSIDINLYAKAVCALGHQAMIVCREDSDYQVSFPVVAIPQSKFESAEFWESLQIDMAIVFTWLRHYKMIKALHMAGVFVVSRGDTDGLISIRLHPGFFLMNALVSHTGLYDKARAFRHWFNRYHKFFRQEEEESLRSLSEADITVVETVTARENIRRFLVYKGQEQINQRLFVFSHLVSEDILEADIPDRKKDRIVSIGRWDSPQKNGPLLARSLTLYLKRRPQTEVLLIGRGGAKLFASLCGRFPHVRYLGVVPHEEVKKYLLEARVILFSSRSEGAPISGNEALALGCSVVGPDIPGIKGVCELGNYGSVAEKRSPVGLSHAIEREMLAWDKGDRDSTEIASFWRKRLSGMILLNQLIAFYEAGLTSEGIRGASVQ